MNILLLRGLMRETRHWGVFLKELEAQSKIRKILCLDLPGVGTEFGRSFSPSIKQVVLDIRSRFQSYEHHNISKDWAILGISLGGMIALKWVEMFPAEFKKIVVMNTSAQNTGAFWSRLKPESMLHVLNIFKDSNHESREIEILKMVSNLKSKDKFTQELWIQIAKESGFDRWTAIQQVLVASQFRAPTQIAIPSLVLTSRADKMVDYKNSVNLAKMYGSQLEIHSTSGHELALDDSSWCVEKICSWL